MGAAKKLQNLFPDKKIVAKKGDSSEQEKSNIEDKQVIEAYLKKIGKLLQDDPKAQKKAALIIEKMLNEPKK